MLSIILYYRLISVISYSILSVNDAIGVNIIKSNIIDESIYNR